MYVLKIIRYRIISSTVDTVVLVLVLLLLYHTGSNCTGTVRYHTVYCIQYVEYRLENGEEEKNIINILIIFVYYIVCIIIFT